MRCSFACLGATVVALALPGGALAATGDLSYQGCISGESASSGCAHIPTATADGSDTGLENPTSVVLSPDGAFA